MNSKKLKCEKCGFENGGKDQVAMIGVGVTHTNDTEGRTGFEWMDDYVGEYCYKCWIIDITKNLGRLKATGLRGV